MAENPWIKQVPTITQSLFLSYEGREALFGGGGGGGKSVALLMAALQYVNCPGHAALILRRSYTDLALPGALMDMAASWLRGTAAKWKDSEKTWRFPSGATLTFGYLESDADRFRYQSSELQGIFFDELTQFEGSQYTYLFSRLRKRKGVNVPLRMRAASNPGGVGHAFVKQRFLVERSPDRIFIPSKLGDNPHIDGDEYRASLMNLDPFTRAQLLDGDWSEFSGGFFRRDWFQVIDVPGDIEKRVRAWDLAATEAKPGTDPDWSVGVLMGRATDKRYIILDVAKTRDTPLGVAALVRKCAEQDGKGVSIYCEQEPGSAGKIVADHYARTVLPGFSFHAIRSTGPKIERAGPLSSQAEAGNVSLIRGAWNGPFLDELAGFPQGAHDDKVDAASLAYSQLTKKKDFWMRFGGDPPDPDSPKHDERPQHLTLADFICNRNRR